MQTTSALRYLIVIVAGGESPICLACPTFSKAHLALSLKYSVNGHTILHATAPDRIWYVLTIISVPAHKSDPTYNAKQVIQSKFTADGSPTTLNAEWMEAWAVP